MNKLILSLIFVGSAFLNAGGFCKKSLSHRDSLLDKSEEVQRELEELLKKFENQKVSNKEFNKEFEPKKEELKEINNHLKCLNYESRLQKPNGAVFKRAYKYAKSSRNSKMQEHIEEKIEKREKSFKFLGKKGLFSFDVAEEKGKIWIQYSVFERDLISQKVESFRKPKKKHINSRNLDIFSDFDKKALAYEIERQLNKTK